MNFYTKDSEFSVDIYKLYEKNDCRISGVLLINRTDNVEFDASIYDNEVISMDFDLDKIIEEVNRNIINCASLILNVYFLNYEPFNVLETAIYPIDINNKKNNGDEYEYCV